MNDEEIMRAANELAKKGRPSPNPYVGCVIVRDNEIISQGFHKKAGLPHAEAEALNGVEAEGASLYVTLEPCSKYGRTPPCTKAIIDAGISKVFYGAGDITQKGGQELDAAGIEVKSGVLEKECEKLNEIFFKYSKTKTPFVCLKAALSLDGMIGSKTGEIKWITCEESRKHVHEIRDKYDAILVGVGTVLADDPKLTCRVDDGRDPLRIILDSRLRAPDDAKVFADDNVLVVCSEACDKEKKIKAEVIVCGKDKVDLPSLLKILGERGITSILVEGGSEVFSSFVREGLVDKFLLFYAPIFLGGDGLPVFKEATVSNIKIESVTRICDDILVEAYP